MDTVDHANKSALMATDLLSRLKIVTEDEAAIVCHAIRSHSNKDNTDCAFDEVLKDADTFQSWLYDPFAGPIAQSRKERCNRVLAELEVPQLG
jgi:hypothetical protein